MVDKQPNFSDIVNQLPQKLQIRFTSLGSYVLALINEVEEATSQSNPDQPRKLTTDDTQFIQLMAFIYMLDQLMRDGTRAARSASTMFESLGMSGFLIGRTAFTRNNANTLRGETLANGLRVSLADQRLQAIIANASCVRSLVERLVQELTRNG